ncbi:unnamed protein product [Orchesella dallaii]|uniref:Uncharacterized protein n=1 Tax=Orchesella dallaii TaxID=48710 RepID=A0ABP1S5M7_9HEXA
MNIYCIIFMCTFGANNTDTEMPNNSIAEKNGNGTDVASLILPGKGEPVPQFGDIVMELPNAFGEVGSKNSGGSANPTEPEKAKFESRGRVQSSQEKLTPSLTDILLPPVPLRGQKI